MNDADIAALAPRLRDLHLPEPIGWWPPAPGWWLLAALVPIALLVGTLARRRDAARRRRATLADALDGCLADWRSDGDTGRYHARVARLLREAAIARAGAPRVAGLAGRRWCDWLGALAPLSSATRETLAEGRYRRLPPETVPEVHVELLACARALGRGDPLPDA